MCGVVHGRGRLHRALPSFPTRRSSDLRDPHPGGDTRMVHDLLRQACGLGAEQQDVIAEEVMDHPRSEEHTSELQSRGHLVCRLLLEKKKHSAMWRRPVLDACSNLTYYC